MHLKAFTPTNPAGDEFLQNSFPRPLADFPIFEMVRDGEMAQFEDTDAESVHPVIRDLAQVLARLGPLGDQRQQIVDAG